MAKEAPVFSAEQLNAINTRDRTLLVSAAAGSGKTTTLTERIIRSITADKNPQSLQNMLIVTFTNAATADLHRKIGEALKDEIAKRPDDTHLERELHLLPSARISTIDSFCNELLRSCADRVGVPPNYRLAEGAEIKILTSSILDALISAVYEGDLPEVATPEQMEALCDCLTDSKSSRALADVFSVLYEKSKSCIDGVGIFRELANNYLPKERTPIEKTPYGKDLMEYAKEALKFYTDTALSISKYLECGTDAEVADADYIKDQAKRIEALISNDAYLDMRAALTSFKLDKKPSCSKDNKTEKIEYARKKLDSWVKDSIQTLREDFFSYTEDEWYVLLDGLHTRTSTLASLLEKFDELYLREKIRRNMLEHSDVARFAYKTLYNPDGSLTDIALAYRDRLTSVYIDEYQDVNALQDAIFRAISKNNRFMVGDIKQSIYGFRSAKPEIFANMKSTFPPLDEKVYTPEASIFMSQNFRCDEGIINFVNAIFDRSFAAVKKSIGYVAEDKLQFKKKYKDHPAPAYRSAEILVLEKPSTEDESSDYDVADDGEPSTSHSPDFIADKILALTDKESSEKRNDGKSIEYSDIAIILRTKSNMESFAAALEQRGIPYELPDTKGYFMNAEVLLALCLLNSIDNPSKDVYLAGLMCSPLYGFTPDDLLRYRRAASGVTLYKAIRTYADEHTEDTRLSAFLSTLEHYRCLAEGMNVDALIMRLYNETGLLALASKNGARDNLMLLYSYARKFEGSSYKGLYSFINYINNVADRDEGLSESANTISDRNCVKIISAHSSKGLEFPVVFFAEASRKRTNLDKRGRIAYQEGYGLSFYLRTPGGAALAKNPIHHLIQSKMDRRYYEEELRVLYVALTRARERLYVVADLTADSLEQYLTGLCCRFDTLTPFAITKMSSMLDIILSSPTDARLEFIPTEEPQKCDTPPDTDGEGAEKAPENEENSEKAPEKEEDGEKAPERGADGEKAPKNGADEVVRDERVYNSIKERFSFEYPRGEKTQIPEKMSVSRLHPSVLDGADDDEAINLSKGFRRHLLPEFITGEERDESTKRGIATHMVLQFCDLDSLAKSGTSAELSRLVEDGFISKSSLERVRTEEIELFRQSELFKEMKAAKKLYRELRFNSQLPAEFFATDAERRAALRGTKVLVQGVIDCIIEDSLGELHLVDYKTDRLNEKELADEMLAKRKMNEAHAVQLTYYALAIEEIFGKRPKTVSVYSMPLGKCLSITPLDEL